MRVRSVSVLAALLAVIVSTVPASAQGGGDAQEEVRRAVERAVGSSISAAVSESLSRSVVSEGLRLMPTTTLFASPFYNRTKGTFDGGAFEADVIGGVGGVLYKVHDLVLVHGAFAGASIVADASEDDDEPLSIDGRFIDFRVGANLVYLNTKPVKGWLTLEAGFSNFDSNRTHDIWAWRAGPSTTLSIRVWDILFEPTAGVFWGDTFANDAVETDMITVFQTGFSLKYRGEQWRPQFNFSYSKIVNPDLGDHGFISFGPELLYAVTPTLLLGVSYTYGTPLTPGLNVDSHTFTANVRWTF